MDKLLLRTVDNFQYYLEITKFIIHKLQKLNCLVAATESIFFVLSL